jgi:hypothetical protein
VTGSDEWGELARANKADKTETLATVGLEGAKGKTLPPNFSGRVLKDPAYVLPMRLLLAMTRSVREKAFSIARFNIGQSNQSNAAKYGASTRDRVLYLPRAQPDIAASQGRLVGKHTGVEYVRAHEVPHRTRPYVREEHLRFMDVDERERERLLARYRDRGTGRPSVEKFFEVNPELARYRWTKADVLEFGAPMLDRAITGLHRVRAAQRAASATAATETTPLDAAAVLEKSAGAPSMPALPGRPNSGPATELGMPNQAQPAASDGHRRSRG